MTTIIRATRRDAAMLAAIHAQCFDQAWDEAAFLSFLENGSTFAQIAGIEGEWLALILMRVAADESEILSLGTNPPSRRMGLARALVEAGAAEAFRRGARRLFLEVAADNDAALSLYGQLGFAPKGRRAGYYQRSRAPPADAVILSTALPLQPPDFRDPRPRSTAWE